MTTDEGASVPPVNQTLTRVVVLLRLLGWVWLIALVVTTAFRIPEANSIVLTATAVTATAGLGLTLLAVRKGFLGEVWYAVLDGAVVMLLISAGWLAGANEFVAGGYPMSWLFIVAYATNLRWTVVAAFVSTTVFAILHAVMGLEMVRTVGSIQFLVVAVVAGWAFDTLRERESLRLRAEAQRAEAEAELAAEREAAARLQERTEIARQLHDSVLQTLKLISSSADDPSEVRYLTRVQERDLRRTINEYRSPYQDSFRARLLDARASIEDRYRVEIEQVIRDDIEMTPELGALIEGAVEAMANAARHSGSPTIDLYAEVRPEGVQINVRDRGRGFDPDRIRTGGMAHSIVGRVTEAGGTADIKTGPDRGTDVSLFLPTQ
ncbi:MAG: ATP-binding protein [Acidimicrobiia bacterium]